MSLVIGLEHVIWAGVAHQARRRWQVPRDVRADAAVISQACGALHILGCAQARQPETLLVSLIDLNLSQLGHVFPLFFLLEEDARAQDNKQQAQNNVQSDPMVVLARHTPVEFLDLDAFAIHISVLGLDGTAPVVALLVRVALAFLKSKPP